jgi:hypothetical protein
MILQKYDDGSQSELYQNGDLVEIIKNQHSALGAKVGEWGKVVLDTDDRENGHAGITSFITIRTAGVSTAKRSFQMCISSVPVWNVKLIPEEMKVAITEAKSHQNCNGMTPSVYRINIDGEYKYGFNFQPIESKIGDCFHYDYGAGINRNKDAKIIWLKELVN